MSLWSFLGMLALAVLAWAGPTWRPRPLPGVDRERPWTLGHRGARGPAPENSVQAMQLAFTHLDGIETDVQRAVDGTLVLWHDFTLQGREVRHTPFAELRRLEPSLATLAEVLQLAQQHPGTVLNLELKSRFQPLRGFALERDALRAVRDAGLQDRTLISSFDPLALARVRLLAPGVRVALLIAPELPAALRDGQLARWLHVDALHPQQDQVSEAMLRRCSDLGLPVHVWTVNDPERMETFVRMGVGALIGDDPVVLARHGKGRSA